MKQFVPIVANSVAFNAFVRLLERTGEEPPGLLRVLTYHRVDELNARPWLDPGLISASPDAFETQMKHLAANYDTVSVCDVLDVFEKRDRKALPARAVMITFDDAYDDFEKYAWPILKQYRIPVTLFVPTAFPDHPERSFWWDSLFHAIRTTARSEIHAPLGCLPVSTRVQRAKAYKRLRDYVKTLPNAAATALVEQIASQLNVSPQENCVLGWDALRELARDGVTLGAHTQTHPILSHISPFAMHKEAAGSLDDLRREIGSTPPVFSYPSGIHNPEVLQALQEAGFKLAFTTERGINDLSHMDPLRVQRINVGAHTSLPVLRAQLLSRVMTWLGTYGTG